MSTAPKTRSGRGWRVNNGTIWALLDSIMQRGFPAALTLTLSLVATPQVVGVVAATSLALTFYQAAFDAPLRLAGSRLIESAEGRRALAITRSIGTLVGAALVLGMVVWIAVRQNLSLGSSLALTVIALAPIANANGILRLVSLQVRGLWGQIALWRLISLGVSALLGMTILLAGYPILGVGIQMGGAEVVFAMITARRVQVSTAIDLGSGRAPKRDILETSLLSVSGWVLGQAERLVLVVAASASTLGLYSIGYAVARAPTDAMVTGLMNRLAARLAIGSQFEDVTIGRTLILMQVVAGSVSVATICAVVPTFALVLGPEWSGAMRAAMLLAVVGGAAAHSWLCATWVNHKGRSSKLASIQLIQLVLGLAVGIGFSRSLVFGAIIAVIRQCAVCIMMTERADLRQSAKRKYAWVPTTMLCGLAAAIATTYSGV